MMNKLLKVKGKIMHRIALFILLVLSLEASADSSNTLGMGIGLSYGGGLGFNITSSKDDIDYYLGSGLLAYNGGATGSNTALGLGIGILHSGFSDSGKHAVGAYLGTVGAKSDGSDLRAYSGIAAQYVYFLNPKARDGLNFGLSAAQGWYAGDRF